MEILIIGIIFIIIMGISVIYGALVWGLVMYKFWGWFVLPIFTNLPAIEFKQAVGLAVFIGLFHTVQSQVLKKEYKDETQSIILPIIAPWVTLIIGWLVHIIIV